MAPEQALALLSGMSEPSIVVTPDGLWWPVELQSRSVP